MSYGYRSVIRVLSSFMPYRLRTFCAAFLLLAALPAGAHPHAWIDVEVEVRFDTAGRVTSLHMVWLFDDIYSAYVTQGLSFTGKVALDPERTARILAVMMKNLARFHYMTTIEGGSRPMEFAAPVEASIVLRGRRLELEFTLPLAEPVPVRQGPVTYSVYDPSYYIEMLHAEKADAVRLQGAPAGCRPELVSPHPDPERVREAAALDRTQSGSEGLGAFFAERVEIVCDTGR
ncbi:MAG: DUF1007 family protein [Gammaproteobacteria bacterium]|nr:DUF1007 family protein [Gammaproteobacteria bacterium]